MAPGASIVVLKSPVSETEGITGMPEFLQFEQYAVNNHIGKIISQSWSATENTPFDAAGEKVLSQFEQFYQLESPLVPPRRKQADRDQRLPQHHRRK